jgi:hypothetical protein
MELIDSIAKALDELEAAEYQIEGEWGIRGTPDLSTVIAAREVHVSNQLLIKGLISTITKAQDWHDAHSGQLTLVASRELRKILTTTPDNHVLDDLLKAAREESEL